ncbi:MAG TPA: hypothetical protein HPP80_02950 [Rhodospirillaceae bacterium]|nr:hypothetical protein [Rhodospirillaceae bacterium]
MSGPSESNGLAELLARLPPSFFDELAPEQRAQLWEAGHAVTWKRHPINIRFSLPWFHRNLFLTVVGGSERRSSERRAVEGRLHRLPTLGNVFFFAGVLACFYFLAMGSLILLRSFIEF